MAEQERREVSSSRQRLPEVFSACDGCDTMGDGIQYFDDASSGVLPGLLT
jgi:hypothetical protein